MHWFHSLLITVFKYFERYRIINDRLDEEPYLERYYLFLKDRENFSRYIYNLHEMVNKMLGKESGLSYCDVRERYEHFRARCTDDVPKYFKFKKQKEKGCTEPLYGEKAKCVIKIVPQNKKCNTMQIDKQCMKTRSRK